MRNFQVVWSLCIVVSSFSAMSANADAAPCFKAQDAAAASVCRADPLVADAGDRFYVWGGRVAGVRTPEATYFDTGRNDGGIYDRSGNLLAALPSANGPGGRFSGTGLWTGENFIVWRGLESIGHSWNPDHYTHHGVIPGYFSPGPFIDASGNFLFSPSTNRWTRIAASPGPGPNAEITLTEEGVKACWDGPLRDGEDRLRACEIFHEDSNVWDQTEITNRPIYPTANPREIDCGTFHGHGLDLDRFQMTKRANTWVLKFSGPKAEAVVRSLGAPLVPFPDKGDFWGMELELPLSACAMSIQNPGEATCDFFDAQAANNLKTGWEWGMIGNYRVERLPVTYVHGVVEQSNVESGTPGPSDFNVTFTMGSPRGSASATWTLDASLRRHFLCEVRGRSN